MWLYFGVCLITGVVQKPEYHMYSTKQHTFATPIFSRLMRRDRFKQLRKMVHFSDPENEDPVDSLRKLRVFLKKIIFLKNIWRLTNICHSGGVG